MVSLGILKRGGEGRSAYRSDNGHTLRISDHSANSENFVDQGENLSVALFDKGRMNFFFEGKNNVIEAVFRTSYLEQNTDAFKNMIGDIARFIATGEYHDTAGALTYHYSGSESFVQEAQDRMLNDAVQRQINSVDEETAQRIIADEDGVRYSSRDIDAETLDMLESLDEDELITTYRSMQLIDGKLYPPMAAVVSGSMEDASQIGSWERAVEHPELVKIDNKGRAKFTLNKGKGQGTISAAYNPYMHSSNLMLNDQFTGAYKRPNLVTVECVVPASEMTSGYHAEFAKDATGWHEWHAGPVASNVSEQRNVFLSRWLKPVRIVDNAEVAREYQRLLSGTNASVPYNVVSPGLLVELEKIGVPIDDKGSGKVPPREDIRYSVRDSAMGDLDDASTYSYENLTSQKDMQVVTIADTYSNPDSGSFRADVVQKAMAAVRAKNNPANTQRRAFVTNTYTGQNIQITPQSIRHGLKMRGEALDINTRAALQIGDIVENAIPVNQLKPRKGIDSSYLYIGIAEDSERYYPVAVVVNRVTETQLEAEKYGILSNLEKDFVASLGTKKGTLRSMRQGLGESRTLNVPTITIADLLETVKPYYADGVSQSVLDMLGVSERPNGTFSKGAMFSLRDTSTVDVETVLNENAQLREANEELRKQFQRTVGVQLDQKAIRKMARDLLKKYDSSYSLDTLTDNLSKVFDVVANGGLTWDAASSAVVDMCRKVLEESSSFDAELYEYDQPVREYLKNVRLEISDDMRGGIELVADNGAAYRRGLFGIVGTARNARLNGMRKTG